MKIVGVANDRAYLCVVSVAEMGMLCGASEGYGHAGVNMIDREYDIRSAWGLIESLQSRRNELPGLAGKLRALADLLEPIAVEIPCVEENHSEPD